MTSKQDLDDLAVSLPPLERQNKIAMFFNLSMREQHLLKEIKARRAAHAQGILMRMASESYPAESNPTVNNKNPGFEAATSASNQK